MIILENPKECCGCNACGDVCPKNAISYKTDIEGFWYPEIDEQKCNNCGLCKKVCPVIHSEELKKNDLPQSIVYAAEHKNIGIIFDSTSGGAFSALADIMYKQKGFVGGAIFNDDFSVKHFISNNKKDILKLRSSKYCQSNLDGFYKEIKQLLQNGENVLVCGCPCQMAGLRAFLGKDYENLIIADFICRGINSPKVWRKYLDTFEARYGSPVVYAKAKSKEYGWRNLTQKVALKNGEVKYETKNESLFTIGYLQTNAYCRPSCYDCKFKGFPRIADVTLADFWGIEKYNKSMEKDLGTSMVLLNSQKGVDYFESVKSRMNFIPMDYNTIFDGNSALTQSLLPPKVDRSVFFNDLDKMTFTEVAKKHFYPKAKPENKIKPVLRNFKHLLQITKNVLSGTQFNWVAIMQFLKYNNLLKIQDGFLLPTPFCAIKIAKNANLNIRGIFNLGKKSLIKNSKLETRLLMQENATIDISGGWFVAYGSHIEVHKGATLKIDNGNKNGGTNVNCTIICSDRIEIGKGVMMGRDVTIRDNNGGHYIGRQGYKNSKPVIIEDKVWLCEKCTIMSGVHIGQGAIVAGNSVVVSDVPAYSLVSGNPARIIDEDVLWKY